MNQLQRERHGPKIIAILIAIFSLSLYYYNGFCLSDKLADKKIEFLSVGVSLGAIWAGFIGVIMGLFMTIPQGTVLTILRNSGYIEDLHDYLVSSIQASLLFSGISLIGFFFLENYFQQFFSIWIFCAVYALLTFLRISKIMYQVMRYLHTHP